MVPSRVLPAATPRRRHAHQLQEILRVHKGVKLCSLQNGSTLASLPSNLLYPNLATAVVKCLHKTRKLAKQGSIAAPPHPPVLLLPGDGGGRGEEPLRMHTQNIKLKMEKI